MIITNCFAKEILDSIPDSRFEGNSKDHPGVVLKTKGSSVDLGDPRGIMLKYNGKEYVTDPTKITSDQSRREIVFYDSNGKQHRITDFYDRETGKEQFFLD